MDIETIRKDTPGCITKKHFNNAGCSLPTRQVVDAITNYLKEEACIGGYQYADTLKEKLDRFYTSTAQFLNCNEENIALTTSNTDGYSKALSSIHFNNGDVILTTKNDYVSNQIHFLSLQKRFGVQIIRAQNTINGEVDCNDIEFNIKKYQPKIVAVTHVPTNSGMVQDIETIGSICENHSLIYLVDACQSAGQIPLDVKSIKCDFLSASLRKFMRGPRGNGFLYVSNKALQMNLEPSLLDNRGASWIESNKYNSIIDAKRFEYIEFSPALVMGSIVSIDYINEVGIKNIELRNIMLCNYARKKLSSLPQISLLDKGSKLCSLITLSIQNKNLLEIKASLEKNNINISYSDKLMAIIDFTEKQTNGALRISPHYYNTIEEIDNLVDVLSELIK